MEFGDNVGFDDVFDVDLGWVNFVLFEELGYGFVLGFCKGFVMFLNYMKVGYG